MIPKINIKFFRSFSIFTTANIINSAIPFLLLPLLTTYLTPVDFGIISMFIVLSNLLLPFVGYNSDGSISRQYFEKDNLDFSNYVTNALYILLFSCILIIPVFLLWGREILVLLFGDDASDIPLYWLWLSLLIVLGQNFIQIQQVLLQVQYKAISYGLLRIGRTTLELGLSMLLIISFNQQWEGRLSGQLFPVIVFSFITVGLLYKGKWIKYPFNWNYIKINLKYGVPLIPHVLSGVIITFSDRLFITNMVGLSDTGQYSVGYQVGMIMSLLQSSFNQAWVPWFFGKLKENSEALKLKIVKFTYFYFLMMLIAVAVIVLLAPLFFKLFIGEQFQSGLSYVWLITLGFGINGMYKMVVNYLFYLQKTYIISIMTIFTAGLNILLNYFLIKKNGALGAAQATVISFTVEFVIIWIVSAKLFKMPWLFFWESKRDDAPLQ